MQIKGIQSEKLSRLKFIQEELGKRALHDANFSHHAASH